MGAVDFPSLVRGVPGEMCVTGNVLFGPALGIIFIKVEVFT